MAQVEYEVGNFDQGAAYLNRLIGPGNQPTPQSSLIVNAAAALLIPIADRITGNVFRLGYSEAAAHTVLSLRYAVPAFQSIAHAGLGLVAAQRADGRLAAEQYSALEPYRDNMTLFCLSVGRVLGILAHTMGSLDLAITHFEENLVFCRKAGYRPELAWTCCDYADTLRERGSEGDRAKALTLLDESLAISSELVMRPLMERVLSRRDILRS